MIPDQRTTRLVLSPWDEGPAAAFAARFEVAIMPSARLREIPFAPK